MRIAQTLRLGLVAALGLPACNWNDFDGLLDKAPVVSFDTGGSSTGSLSVLPLLPPLPGGKVSARMLVGRRDSAYLAMAEFDKDGKVSLQQLSKADMDNLGAVPIKSMAALDPGKPDSPILLGTPSFGGGETPPGQVSLLSVTTLADGTASYLVQPGVPGDSRLGLAVAAGKVTGPTSPGEFVAVGDFVVRLLGADGRTPIASTACQGALTGASSEFYPDRPVVVADLVPGGGDEIVLSGPPRVVFLQYNSTTGTLDCLLLALTDQNPPVRFGTSLATADFDGDGNMDLAVGTPPDHVYVYFGPLAASPGAGQTAVAIKSSGSSRFGEWIAAYTPYTAPGQTKPKAQLLVADPSATVGGRSGAGQVLLISVPPRGTPDLKAEAAAWTVTTLFDSAEDAATGGFGNNLGSLWFDTRTCNPAGGDVTSLPWATSRTSLLAFFKYPTTNSAAQPLAPVADPRCFVK